MYLRLGLILIGASFLPWLAILLVPWIPLLNTATQKTGAVGILILLAEIIFWSGLLLAGRDTWKLIRRHGWKHAPKEFLGLFRQGRD